MIEACEVCGIKFADASSVKAHSLKVHKFASPSPVTIVLPVIGDGSTGIKGLGVVVPTRTSKKSQAQIAAELEDRLGIHNFHGYEIEPIQLVRVEPDHIENSYADFFKKLGTFEFDREMIGR